MNKNKLRAEAIGDKAFDIVIAVILIAISLIVLYPLYFTVIASISNPYSVANGKVTLWPEGLTLDSYREMIKNKDLWMGYKNTFIYTIFGTMLSLVLTVPAAYALSKKTLWQRKTFNTFFLITMYFSGGLLPTYLLVKDIDLYNKPYTLIILSAFSVYNMIVVRTYFQNSIPEELYEAAEIDGSSEFGKFFNIALPLAKPVISVVTLYYAVGRWNEYFNSLVYVSQKKYYSLQLVLRNILLKSQMSGIATGGTENMDADQLAEALRQQYLAEGMKYAVIFIAAAPMLMLYPLVQKYFVKGMMVGSVKS